MMLQLGLVGKRTGTVVVGWKFAVAWDVVGAVVSRKWARSVSDSLQQVSLADLGMC